MAVKDRAAVAEFLKANDRENMDLHQQRARIDALGDFFSVPDNVTVEEARVGGIKGEWVRARHARRDAALLYLHGGGYVIGSPKSHRHLAALLSEVSDLPVFVAHYRLAPEHPFPAAVDDSWAALQALVAGAEALGLDGSRIAVGGDSAGGTLAAVTALYARDAGLPLALQLLITPGTCARADTESHARFAKGYLLDADAIAWFFDHYIAEAEREDWRFAPLHAADHEGLAPALVMLAEADPLVDEGLAYAEKLRTAGVKVTIADYPDLVHGFIYLQTVLPQAHDAMTKAAKAVKAALDAA